MFALFHFISSKKYNANSRTVHSIKHMFLFFYNTFHFHKCLPSWSVIHVCQKELMCLHMVSSFSISFWIFYDKLIDIYENVGISKWTNIMQLHAILHSVCDDNTQCGKTFYYILPGKRNSVNINWKINQRNDAVSHTAVHVSPCPHISHEKLTYSFKRSIKIWQFHSIVNRGLKKHNHLKI